MRLLYFSPVTWESYYQRPHYMIKYFLNLNSNNTVLWINPYPTRFPNFKDILQARPKAGPKTDLLERLRVLSPRALPIEPLYKSELINYYLFWKKLENFYEDNMIVGIGKPSKLALMMLKQLNYKYSFYDAMDDFPEFYQGLSRQSMKNTENNIASKVNQTIVSSSKLAEKFPKALKILNGYVMTKLPDINLEKTYQSKILGYVGTIGQWFDWDKIIKLAKNYPDYKIRLIGPLFVPYNNKLPENIELLPECTQQEALQHVSLFRIGLIPFKQNHLTQGVDPIKYYEYRAMGLPVVSTQFGEMLYRNKNNGVYDFNEIDQALAHRDNKESINLFRQEHDWSSRFSKMDFLYD